MTTTATQPTSPAETGSDKPDRIARFFAAIQDGDQRTLEELLTADAVMRWPQSGERLNGPIACIRVYQNYPGGPPKYEMERISGQGQLWVAEMVGQYGDDRWYAVSIIEFEGDRIARTTDYFGPTFPAPEWRQEWVEREDAAGAR